MSRAPIFPRHAFTVLACCALAGCSSGGLGTSPYPYKAGTTNVIGTPEGSAGSAGAGVGSPAITSSSKVATGSATPIAVGFPTPTNPEDCIQLEGKCLKPQKDCGQDGTADVIVGPDGAPLSVICYPNRDYDVVVLGDAPVTSLPLGNNTVIVLDDKNDGVDVEGDLTIKGNNVIVYGYGPDTSVIGGNLTIDKNNAIVRGVRINGDVSISKNNASLIDCVIEGDLTISGNNVNLALCQIWGRVTIEGENAVFVSNLVLDAGSISGKNLRCNDNRGFVDANKDGALQDSEIAEPIVCGSR